MPKIFNRKVADLTLDQCFALMNFFLDKIKEGHFISVERQSDWQKQGEALERIIKEAQTAEAMRRLARRIEDARQKLASSGKQYEGITKSYALAASWLQEASLKRKDGAPGGVPVDIVARYFGNLLQSPARQENRRELWRHLNHLFHYPSDFVIAKLQKKAASQPAVSKPKTHGQQVLEKSDDAQFKRLVTALWTECADKLTRDERPSRQDRHMLRVVVKEAQRRAAIQNPQEQDPFRQLAVYQSRAALIDCYERFAGIETARDRAKAAQELKDRIAEYEKHATRPAIKKEFADIRQKLD